MMKYSVVIPTYNRPAYLKRILSYYHQYGTGLPIVIADSSSEENKKLNRETVSSFQDAFFTYLDRYDPSTSFWHKIVDALQQVSTGYCVFCADDDFVTPNGINQSVDFLEHNPDYTVAHGSYIRFRLEGNGPDKRYFGLNMYCSPEFNALSNPASGLRNIYAGLSIVFPGAVERLRYKLADYPIPTFYAVHRTDFLRLAWEETRLQATTLLVNYYQRCSR
jgi:glycosyltransferase domain-containing protein